MIKWILLLLIFLVPVSGATSTYDVATNTITIVNGTNYPWTIHSDVSNTTAFNRIGNESIMTANMTIQKGSTLYIYDELFNFNCSSDYEYGIHSEGILRINNSTLTVTNISFKSRGIQCDEGIYHNAEHILSVTNSEILYLGGYGYHSLDSYCRGNPPATISNNIIYGGGGIYLNAYQGNTSTISSNMIYDSTSPAIHANGAISVIGNTIYNISEQYATCIGIYGGYSLTSDNILCNDIQQFAIGIYPKESTGVTVHNNTVSDAEVGIRASYYSYFVNSDKPNIITNNTVFDCSRGMETSGNIYHVNFSNNQVYDCWRAIYLSNTYNLTFNNNIWRDSTYGILFGAQPKGTATFINDTINNNDRGLTLWGGETGDIYEKIIARDCDFYSNSITDVDMGSYRDIHFINTNFSSSIVNHIKNKLLVYYYSDILVHDSVSVAINEATVTFENTVNPSYPSIDINGNNQSSYQTGADGHTYKPNELISVVLLDTLETLSGITHMEWNISADANEHVANTSAITELNLTSGYYRSDPDIYQNTSIIILGEWSYNSDYVYTNVIYRYYTDGTRSIIGRNPLETDMNMGDIQVVVS